jgi:NTE family protein
MSPAPHTAYPDLAPGQLRALGLVMGGGGARAAYQVGMLRALAKRAPDLEVPIITGTSAGAINAVHLAAHPGTFAEAVEDLVRLWSDLRMDQVFRVDSPYLARNLLRWGLQLATGGWLRGPGELRSLVETMPLRRFLCRALGTPGGSDRPIEGIRANIEAGRLRALAISTSSYTTGRSVTWVEGREGLTPWERPLRRARVTRMTVDHVMASAALPLIFPAVQVGGEWYGDGGIRLSAPLSPALHLGADRILAISTRFDRTTAEEERPQVEGYPPPAQVAGQLMNAVFLDLLDQDTWRVQQTNRLLRHVPPEERGDLRVVDIVTLRPSLDLGRLAADFEIDLPRFFRFLVRGLGTDRTRSPDLLSFVLFEPGYLGRLIELGEKDAEERMIEMEDRILGRGPPPDRPDDGAAPAPGERGGERGGARGGEAAGERAGTQAGRPAGQPVAAPPKPRN